MFCKLVGEYVSEPRDITFIACKHSSTGTGGDDVGQP